ncbi:hypothetical protein [Rhizobium oryzicola]|uniref:hypothetical protein n=1 Tax=Rhizobium oryzicola TaxID=1232668 RepID=UPI003F53435E
MFRPVRDLEFHLADTTTAAGVVFDRHDRSAGLFQPKPITSPPMKYPCANALWEVIAGRSRGRDSKRTITLFASIGFTIEDFSALRHVRSKLEQTGLYVDLDLLG